jgi:hypothetical protein
VSGVRDMSFFFLSLYFLIYFMVLAFLPCYIFSFFRINEFYSKLKNSNQLVKLRMLTGHHI